MTSQVTDNEVLAIELKSTGRLSQVNPSSPPETEEKVRLGKEAMARKRRGWEDWIAIGEATEVGRADAMREANTNEAAGKRYETAMAKWLVVHSFKEIDKGTRSRLLECLKNKSAIEAWRSRLTDAERFRFNHPNTVFRKWKAATEDSGLKQRTKSSQTAKLEETIARLSEENRRLRREIDHGRADLAGIAAVPLDTSVSTETSKAPVQLPENCYATVFLPKDEPRDLRALNTALFSLEKKHGVNIEWSHV